MKSLKALAAFLTYLACVSAYSQTSKTGSWEITCKVGGNLEMDKATADMQKQMEAMVGKQGMSMYGPVGTMVVKSCVTKEMVEQRQLPVQTQGNCTSTVGDKTSNSVKFKYVCINPASSGGGVV
jgi:hypothetical protein